MTPGIHETRRNAMDESGLVRVGPMHIRGTGVDLICANPDCRLNCWKEPIMSDDGSRLVAECILCRNLTSWPMVDGHPDHRHPTLHTGR